MLTPQCGATTFDRVVVILLEFESFLSSTCPMVRRTRYCATSSRHRLATSLLSSKCSKVGQNLFKQSQNECMWRIVFKSHNYEAIVILISQKVHIEIKRLVGFDIFPTKDPNSRYVFNLQFEITLDLHITFQIGI